MPMTEERARQCSDIVLDTVETFLETCPNLEGMEIDFGERLGGEEATVRMMKMRINGEPFLVQCKRGG